MTPITGSNRPRRRLRFLFSGTAALGISALLIAADFVEGLLTGAIAILPAVFGLVMLAAYFGRRDFGP